ncbi:hypothetical protein [Actinomadura madurae]|uniref:hypothetical protein n=1 Tax=Actinomadura madurae TaxID=1993 RepID=UPI0020D2378A|nr:hypothetical protein [Actinomadura madurae]MCP9947222.1 hypothetical protein [Actinomadura madurae]MCP9963987.1 hypothetical protein [Actinomadura madurae]MCP9976462.1 hypothetical protein [Actinomadura madurae]MCQ0012045.1 hypothetical protein [Actinomadura madurae]MCQ0012655.1 hypothetical protein [Actinomadura madurae]
MTDEEVEEMRARLAYLREGPSRGSSADPRLSELTARAVAIDLPCTHVEILEALYRIWRDIDLAFGFSPGTTPPDLAELKREFGKLVLSSLRWMRHYGLDPADCLDAAETAQRAYTPPPAADRPRVAEDGVAYLTDTGRYVIADQGGWVTGSYATEAAARLAVSLDDEQLVELRDRINREAGRGITVADLRAVLDHQPDHERKADEA